MTKIEMSRRLATLTGQQIKDVLWHIAQGFGAEGIKHETGLTIKQINAVFAYSQRA